MKENYMVCNCKQVSYATIEDEVHKHSSLQNVMDMFKEVQDVTHCSTGCGGCYEKVLDVISEIMMG